MTNRRCRRIVVVQEEKTQPARKKAKQEYDQATTTTESSVGSMEEALDDLENMLSKPDEDINKANLAGPHFRYSHVYLVQ